MATADGPEWKRCDEHGIRYDDHLCPLCQGQGEGDDGRQGQDTAGGFDGVPTELTDRDRWMLYDTDAEERRPFGWDNGRLDKGASWKNDDDLLSFDDAREAAATKESYGTIYIVDEDSPFAVIDIDGGIYYDDDGRPRPKEWLPKVAPLLGDTYTDLSPSGTGIHVWYRGDLPEWWEDQQLTEAGHEGVDAFDGDTPMTVTGDAPPAPWGDRADTIAPIDDDAVGFLQDAWGNLADESDESTPWKAEPDTQTPDESRSNPVPSGEWLGEAEAKEALEHIDRKQPYEKWRNLCFALNDHFGDHRAKQLFTEWSRQGSKWDEKSGPQVDEFIERDDSGITIATLIHHAKAGGWTPAPVDGWAAYYDDHDEAPTDYSGGVPWGAVKTAYIDDDTSTQAARRRAVEKLLSDHTYVSPRDTEAIWVYRPGEGIYDRQGEAHIKEKLTQNLGVTATGREINQVLIQVRGRCPIDREAFDDGGNPRLVCFKNGVLDLETRELHPHSAEYLFRKRGAAKYDPEADGQVIRDFFRDLTGREADAKVLAELVGLCLWQGHDIRSVFGVLIGDGANGKGMFEKLLTRFFGPDNVENIGLQTLENNRFAVAQLENSFANLGSDIPGAKVNDLPTIKSITGGDHIQVERKYEDGYSAKIPATPIFSVNEPPTFGEKGHALARRIVPVEFPHTFKHDPGDGEKQAEKESKLMDRLTTPEALSGLLNVGLDGLDRVRENGDVSLPEGPAERLEKYEKKADPISAFADGCIENRDEAYVTKADAYQAYVAYCDKNDKEAKTKGTFYRELRRAGGPTITETQVRLGDLGDKDRVRVLKNLYFTAKGRELGVDLDVTRAVNRKRGNVDLPGNGPAPGIDHDNPENRGFGQKEIVDDIRQAAAFNGGGVPKDELAAFVAESGGYDPDTVKAWIDRLEGQRLTKTPGGYDAVEKADLSELTD